MSLLKLLTSIALSVGLGFVFIYSGYTKLLPVVETFEFTFIEIGIANWYSAPVIARLLIGLEFFLGLLLITNFNLKRFTLPLTIGLLTIFIVYLIAQIIVSGNNGNCGCFGEHFSMTPLQAIIKNAVMILGALGIYRFHNGWTIKSNIAVLLLSAIPSLFVPFVLNPVDYSYTSNNLDEKIGYPLELNLLYEPEDTSKVDIPSIDLRQGKQVVAFLSLTCSHCRVAAKKFRLIKRDNPNLPIYFVLNGKRERYKEFLEDTRADNIPSSFCLGKTFLQLASSRLPRIYYLENGIVKKKVDYFELNQYDIEKWINTTTTE